MLIPDSARPHEVAILIVYHVMKIKAPRDIAATLHYRDRSQVDRVLKKFGRRQLSPVIRYFADDNQLSAVVNA